MIIILSPHAHTITHTHTHTHTHNTYQSNTLTQHTYTLTVNIVLSVVAQQVLSILNAKKSGISQFQFPGDPQMVALIPCCGFFITMNPGYAGRQELPENLKVQIKKCSIHFANSNSFYHYD